MDMVKHWTRFQSLMLPRLARILGTAVLPPVFCFAWPKPLKIGIHQDIIDRYPQVDASELSRWLHWWTRNHGYVVRLTSGKHRHDLYGNDVADIAAGDAVFATALIGAKPAAARRRTLHLPMTNEASR